MKLDKKPEKDLPASQNTFSKVGNIDEPDSPPPEKKVETEEPSGMSKFD
jgi:hypothetical protein